MHDDDIVALYLARDETAIPKTAQKYEHYLTKIANNILADWEDSRESVNDTYLKAWNSIPPHRPAMLSTYLGKITREQAIDRLRSRHSEKRPPSEYAQSLSELEDCVSGDNFTEAACELQLLIDTINAFLYKLPPEPRHCFIARYFFSDSIREIANCFGMSEAKVKSLLHRTRLKLKARLKQEGFYV